MEFILFCIIIFFIRLFLKYDYQKQLKNIDGLINKYKNVFSYKNGTSFKLEAVKDIFATAKHMNDLNYKNDVLLSLLKQDALECSSEESKNTLELLQLKRYAFDCLKILSPNIIDKFSLTFYNNITNILISMDQDFTITSALNKLKEQEKLLIVKTLLICLTEGDINLSIFEEFPSNEWRRELLTFTLLSKINSCNMEAKQLIIEKINYLYDLLQNKTIVYWTVEDILETLVCHKEGYKFNVLFLNDLFFIIPRKPKIFIKLSENFSIIKNEIENYKLEKINNILKMHRVDDRVILKYLLKYPIEVVDKVCSKVRNDNLNGVITFISILKCSDIDFTHQIKFLLRLKPNDNITEWICKLYFVIIGNFISNIFPLYENYRYQKDNVLKDKNNLCKIYSSLTKERKKTLEHICTDCYDLLYILNCSLAQMLSNNCNKPSKEIFKIIGDIISGINSEQKIAQIINALNTLDEYNIQFSDKTFNNLLLKLTDENCEREIHRYTIEHSFPETYEKSLDQLMKELKQLNPELTNSSIIEQFENIQIAYNNKSQLFPEVACIKSWDKSHIKNWAKVVRLKRKLSNINLVQDEEMIAVIMRAADLTTDLQLRNIQLLSVIIMIRYCKGKGRLSQINTGEGKTLIIAIIAAYYVLKGHQVDVYTSSPTLAIPQSKEFEQFYLICEITVSDNIFNNTKLYNCDVIYGTNNSFQADVLRDEFRKSGVRKGRKFDIAIIDEVDNMLIDGNNWILMLSCDMPAMDYLEAILAAIYIQVNAVISVMTERDGKVYYLEQGNAMDEEGNIKPEVIFNEIEIQGNKIDFITKCVETHIRKLIRDTDSGVEIEAGYAEIKIPKHLREVVCKTKLNKWIRMAIHSAFNYIKGEDYILKDGKVTIVDTSNTGVVKKSSHWTNGLHQFLQIKHGAKIQPESFTTNFLSNVGIFTRYSSIFGLTGTLGCNGTKEFLQGTYDVDSMIIPSFKLKRHKHLKPIIINKVDMWYLEIAKSCIRKLRNGRAALIIMKFIRETEQMADIFEKSFNYDKSKIKLYRTDDDSEIVESHLKSGDVIITTNIAGRGTDIKFIQEVEENGGLHVCLTFLPVNSRVEEQNIGRTSRKGNRGTSQFILYDSTETSIENLKAIRTRNENAAIRGATEQVKNIKTKDKIFQMFCDLLGQIKGRNLYVKEIEQTAVEERFAIWLEMNEDHFGKKNEEIIFQDFKVFSDEILNDDRNGKLIKNPCMFVEIGNKYLKEKRFANAIDEYTSAIILDHNFAEHAYYNRAWALLGKYGNNLNKNEHFINEAIRDLQKARKLIEEKEYSFHLLQTASKGEVILQQISHKSNLYNLQKNTIEMAIGPDTDAIDEQLKKLEKEKKSKDITEDEKCKISEILLNLEKSKENIGVIGRAKQNKHNIKIESLTNDEFMPKSDRECHEDEIEEFERNGWMGGFKVTEIKPINWTAVIGLLGIGLGQLIIGSALTVFTLGAGASIGMGLVSEGVSDLITAIKDGIINREFNWATWALQKVISITVSIVCAGLKAIKDVARTAYAGVKNVAVSGAKAFTQTTKEGLNLVAKKIGLDLAKGVAKEIVTDLVNYGIDKTLIPLIEEKIIELVKDPIQQALIDNPKVKEMLKFDEKNKNHNYENQIRSLGEKILNPAKNSMLSNIAIQIATRVADNKGLGTARQIGTALIGIYQLSTFTSDFIQKMNESIDKVKIDNEKVNKSFKISDNQKVSEQVNNEEHEMYRSKTKDGDIDLNKVRQSEEEQVQLQQKIHSTDNLSDALASMVSTNMLNIIKGKIISPAIQFGANYTVEKFSSQITTSLNEQTENYRSFKRVLHNQNKGYQNTKDKQPQEKNKLNKDEIRKVDELIKNVESGGPAGLLHLGAVSDAANRPIEVYDEKGRLKYTVGDTKKGKPVKIQYHPPENGSEIGHFTLNGSREPLKTVGGNNMCLFNVVAEQTGQNPNDLKTSTLNIMEKNKSTVAKQVKDIKRLEAYQNSRLLKGGAKYNGNCPDDAADLIKKSDGVKGHGNNNKAHPFDHVPFKGKTLDRLNAISVELKKKIEIYDKNGQKTHTIGDEYDGEPIKLQYNKPEGNTSGEYFTTIGGQENYQFHHPDDMEFYEIIGKQTGKETNATNLKSATLTRINDMTFPEKTHCVEWASRNSHKTGFITDAEQAFVTHYALKTKTAQEKIAKLNNHIGNPDNPEICKQVTVVIPVEELNLPRQAFGGNWEKGKCLNKWPVTEVVLVLQHFRGKQNDLEAPIHIHTCYPRDPFPPPSTT